MLLLRERPVRSMCGSTARALVVGEVERAVAELAHVRRTCANLALLVDDRVVVLSGDASSANTGQRYFTGKVEDEQVVDEPRARLGLEWIDEQLGMPVEESVSRVAAVLVHRSDHQQLEVVAHRVCRLLGLSKL